LRLQPVLDINKEQILHAHGHRRQRQQAEPHGPHQSAPPQQVRAQRSGRGWAAGLVRLHHLRPKRGPLQQQRHQVAGKGREQQAVQRTRGVHKYGQHRPQRLGRQVASADDAKQSPALPHVKYHRRHPPKLQVGEQVNKAVAGHDSHGYRHRRAQPQQQPQHQREHGRRQQRPPSQLAQQQVVLVVGIQPPYPHHSQRPHAVSQRQVALGVVVEQQHVGRHVHQYGADAEQKIMRKKESHRFRLARPNS
jgi:hypothetical protein